MPRNAWTLIKDMVEKDFATYSVAIGKRGYLEDATQGYFNTAEIYTVNNGAVCFQHLDKNDIVIAVFVDTNIRPAVIKRIWKEDYYTLSNTLNDIVTICHEATYDGGFTTEAVVQKFKESKYKKWVRL